MTGVSIRAANMPSRKLNIPILLGGMVIGVVPPLPVRSYASPRRNAKSNSAHTSLDAQAKESTVVSFACASGLCAKATRRDFAVLLTRGRQQ